MREKNATHGCDAKIGNATPHQRFRRGEFPFGLETRHILLPHRSVFELNYVQGHDSTSAHAHGPGESVESRNTPLFLLEFSQFKNTNNFENELYVCILFKVHNWKETRKDFFFFRPATQDHDVIDADNDSEMYSQDEIAEDDILYAQPTTYEGDSGNTLLFVHQSTEQLAILKR